MENEDGTGGREGEARGRKTTYRYTHVYEFMGSRSGLSGVLEMEQKLGSACHTERDFVFRIITR